mgnify:CR=1 FL=1
MVSRTRSVSSRSKSARSGSATSTTPRVGTTYGVHGEVLSKPPQRPKHTSHRAPKKTRKHKHLVLKWVLGIFAALIAAGIGLFAYMYITTEIPQPEKFALAEKTTVYYNDGTTPIGSYAEQNREIISCADLPDYVGNAIVASEDRSFYTNKGIDPIGIARAFYNNLTTGSRQGGSTITQQYAERYYLGETTSYVGKLREAFLAVKIAQAQDKSQVLCNYMNTIYLGRGAYGIQAAAKAYFGKDAKDLTLSEAAMLAGIIPAPSVWTPDVNPKQAEKRYKRVLNIMDEDSYITPDEKKAAKFPQTIEIQQNNQMSGPNGYLLTMVQNELVNTKAFSKQDLETGGYKIVTTIDKSKQDLMFSTISPSQNGMQGIVPDGMQFGALSVNPKDGSIISLYAGDDYLTKQLNNVTQATYEVGSTMKPFALLAAVNEGVSLNTYFNGNSYRTFPGITETVSNYGGENLGYVNLYTATEQSSNTVYMDLQTKLGAQKIAETARQAGVDDSSLDGSNPFTVLGNNGLTLKDMTQGYATLANQGNKPTLHIVAQVQTANGTDLYNAPTSAEQTFEANNANLVTKALTGVVQRGTATEARATGHTIAGKSGTANDSNAASFIGYTPSMLTSVAMWYPDDNGNPQDEPATIAAWCYFGITNVCSDPERAYAIFDDMATPENWIHKKFGVEGRDYKDNGDGTYEIINPGDGAVNTEQNLGINLFQDLFARKDAANIANTEETTELFEKVKENSRDAYAKTIEKKNPDAYTVNNDLGTDIGDAMKEYTWGVIGGGKSLDDWDSYVDKINGLGLQDVLDELKEIHGKQVEDYQKYLEEYNK